MNKHIIDFPLVDITWQNHHQETLQNLTPGPTNITQQKPKKRQNSTSKAAFQQNHTHHDLTPSIYNEMPTYPLKAKQQEIEISFTVSLILNKNGQVTHILFPTNNKPPAPFREEVTKKLSKWKFTSSQNLEGLQINVPLQFQTV